MKWGGVILRQHIPFMGYLDIKDIFFGIHNQASNKYVLINYVILQGKDMIFICTLSVNLLYCISAVSVSGTVILMINNILFLDKKKCVKMLTNIRFKLKPPLSVFWYHSPCYPSTDEGATPRNVCD